MAAQVTKYTLIVLPILGSLLAAFVTKFYPGTDWLVLRAGAEQVLKEIYQYRTILQKTDRRRRNWLEGRLKEIQMQVYNGLNGEMIIKPYKGKLPPLHDNGSERADQGFNDLTAEEYYTLRLRDQLDWMTGRVNRIHRERVMLQVMILFAGGAGTFLAAVGGKISLWVALATSISTALVGWQEIRNLDMTVRNYSKAILDLSAVSDHWNQLDKDERTKKEFYRMVKDTEAVLWNQNMEYVKSMQEAFESAKMEEEDFVNQTLKSVGDEGTQPVMPAPMPSEGTPSG